MKTKILSIFCLALALSSCKKGSEDLMIDGKMPELRSQESLETYGKTLKMAGRPIYSQKVAADMVSTWILMTRTV
jgi:hypothetical protein